jgi:uncharacterized surface protein with fasciclin (FAS1) repeats
MINLEKKPLFALKYIQQNLIDDPLSNLPSLLFMTITIFGVITLFSYFFIDILIAPFIIISTISSLFAMWYLGILGSLKKQVELFEQQNTKLSKNVVNMQESIVTLKKSNDTLHQELTSLVTLRTNLESYAKETKTDFSKILSDVNSSFQRLETITRENEQALLERIAQDLEFLDNNEGMQRDEYERFLERIPLHLQTTFHSLGDTSFEKIAGNNMKVDYKEIKQLVHSILQKESA